MTQPTFIFANSKKKKKKKKKTNLITRGRDESFFAPKDTSVISRRAPVLPSSLSRTTVPYLSGAKVPLRRKGGGW